MGVAKKLAEIINNTVGHDCIGEDELQGVEEAVDQIICAMAEVSPNRLTLDFDCPESKEVWLAWYLDGGGDDNLYEALELQNELLQLSASYNRNKATLTFESYIPED